MELAACRDCGRFRERADVVIAGKQDLPEIVSSQCPTAPRRADAIQMLGGLGGAMAWARALASRSGGPMPSPLAREVDRLAARRGFAMPAG
eukprot:15454388-Alexandrium_andersonii.AAC.1